MAPLLAEVRKRCAWSRQSEADSGCGAAARLTDQFDPNPICPSNKANQVIEAGIAAAASERVHTSRDKGTAFEHCTSERG